MKFMGAATMRIAVCTALCAAVGAAHAATSADQCRQTVGFPVFSGSSDVGAWGTVTANADAFQGRNVVRKCNVDYQVSEGRKGKPVIAYFPVPVDGTMAKDLCATYGELAAIDSKIYLVKFQDAFDKASALAAKLATLRDAGKLSPDGYDAIATGDAGVDKVVSCLNELITQ